MKRALDADAEALLAAIVESSDDAIVGKSLDGTILSWNSAAERIFGYKAEEIIGRSIRALIPSERQSEEDRILASIGRGERVPTFETVRRRKDGSEVAVAITVSPVRDSAGNVVAASKIARDITESKLAQARLEESEARFRLLADNIAQLAWIADREGNIFWFNRRWLDFIGRSPLEMQDVDWRTVNHPDHVERVTERWRRHLESGREWEDTFPLRGGDGEYRWFLSRAKPIRDRAGEITYWFGTNTDVTQMRDAEQRIQLLLREVNHRSKNMLAVVQSLARRSGSDGEGFLDRLEQRIQGLAASQDLLVERSWTNVPIRDMIAAQLRFLGDTAQRCRLDGPEVLLLPGAAETLAMAMHELATNALKYGSLSEPGGSVSLTWAVQHDLEPPRFRIEWVESGGPQIAEPASVGFGTAIISDVPQSKLHGEVSLEYPPSGFRWSLTCDRSEVSP